MQRHCRHYPANSTLGKKKGECLLLDRVLRTGSFSSGGWRLQWGSMRIQKSLPLQSGQIRAINQSH